MSNAQLRTYRQGEYLFRESEPSQSMFLIQKGSVGIRKVKEGAFIELAKLYPNEVVGELSFFDRQPRSASAVALSPVEALEISFDSMDKIYKQVPPYLQTIMACVADRLRKADETIRRLQKNLVADGEGVAGEAKDEELTAAELLAATANIDLDGGKNQKPE